MSLKTFVVARQRPMIQSTGRIAGIAEATIDDRRRLRMTNIVEREPEPPRVDKDIDNICMKCLRRAPEDRYASAAGVAADLRRYLADEPVVARPLGRGERVLRWLRRNPVPAAASAAALALLVTTSIVAVQVASAQEQELRNDVLTTNAFAARALSGAVLFELRELADQARNLADDPNVAVVLESKDSAAIDAWRAQVQLGPFASVLLLSDTGAWAARAPDPKPDHRGEDYSWRDYFQGAARYGQAGRRDVHVSRAYVSTARGTVRFSLATPVFTSDGVFVGVLEAAVETSDALGGLVIDDSHDRSRTAALVARADRQSATAPLPSEWYVMLHDGVSAGSKHVMSSSAALGSLASSAGPQLALLPPGHEIVDDNHHDPVPGFDGRWLAGFAPIGGTPFAVIVQTRDAAAVEPNHRLGTRLFAAGGAALVAAAVALMFVVALLRRRSAS